MAFNKPNAPKEVVFNRYDGGDSKILKKVNYGLQESMRVLALILPPIGNELSTNVAERTASEGGRIGALF